jgi:hypothetical protein
MSSQTDIQAVGLRAVDPTVSDTISSGGSRAHHSHPRPLQGGPIQPFNPTTSLHEYPGAPSCDLANLFDPQAIIDPPRLNDDEQGKMVVCLHRGLGHTNERALGLNQLLPDESGSELLSPGANLPKLGKDIFR